MLKAFGELKRGLIIAASAVILFGCQSGTTYTAMEQGVDAQKCEMFGYKPGSDDHRRCMFYTYGERERQTAANNQAAAAVLAGVAVVGLAAAAAATAPRYPSYWCNRWRCYYY
jgi:hypothetical protein